MKTERMFITVSALLLLAMAYVGGYLVSVTRLQVSYGNGSAPVLAVYNHPWQRAMFRPIEHLDRSLFPGRWRYDQSKQTSATTR